MANLGYIQITRCCNQACRTCSNPELDATVTLEEGQRLIDDVRQDGCDGVILTGGEPTLHPDLAALVRYCRDQGIHPRIISNGRRLADRDYLESLVAAGLDHVHLSVYSNRPETLTMLTGRDDAHEHVVAALDNLGQLGVNTDINTAISHYNADHLDEVVRWLTGRWPFLHHFVWDHLDPTQNRASENPDVIPKLWESELSLKRAMDYLASTGRTFRVERLPLCYMVEHAHCSTETRKIVFSEGRIIHFLDEKGKHTRTSWHYGKAECCKICTFDPICVGLWEMDNYYSPDELYPVFVSPEPVIRRIKEA